MNNVNVCVYCNQLPSMVGNVLTHKCKKQTAIITSQTTIIDNATINLWNEIQNKYGLNRVIYSK